MGLSTKLVTDRYFLTLLLTVLAFNVGVAAAQSTNQAPSPADEAIHAQLRALKDRAIAAVGRRDIDALLAEADPNVAFTAMDNEIAHGREAVRAYFEKMMTGDSRIVQDLHVTFEPDASSTLYNGGNNAVSVGSSKAHFKLVRGLEFDVDGRWTADLAKENDKWLITAFHYSVSLFDNPLLGAAKRMIWYVGIGATLVGVVVGFWIGRRHAHDRKY
jgi:ketosteroid isomerase-like protein